MAQAGAAGASLCALSGHDWFGYTPEGRVLMGPWHNAAVECDEYFDPNDARAKEYGRAVNVPWIQLRWPAASGPGMQAKEATATCGNDGSFWINWFDPATFSFFTSAPALEIRKAFEDVGGPVPPLAQRWAAGVVVKAKPRRGPAGDAYVFLDPAGRHGAGRQAVRADAGGRAWFSVYEPGRYVVTALCGLEVLRGEVTVRPRTRPTPRQAGYAHLQWVALGGADVAAERARLAQPAEIDVRDRMPREAIGKSWPTAAQAETAYQPGPFAPTEEGFLTDWLVLGPFPNPGDREKGYQGMATDFLAAVGGEAGVRPRYGERVSVHFPKSSHWDEGDVALAWRPWEGTKSCDLARLTLPEVGLENSQPPDVVAYAACYVFSPKAQPARLAIGSDDGNKVWLNGAKVGEDLQHGGAQPDERVYDVALREGANLLLVKCDQSYGGWEFYLRFLSPAGAPLTGLRIGREPDIDPGFSAADRLGKTPPAALPFVEEFGAALDPRRWIEVGPGGNGSATTEGGDLLVTVTAGKPGEAWQVHGVATTQTFDFLHGPGLAFEWETSPSRSWYTMPYVVLTTLPTGDQVHVDTNPTWAKQPRFVVQLPAVTGEGRNSGLRVFAQNPGELIHLSQSLPGEEVPRVLQARCRLEIGPKTYALYCEGKLALSGEHGLRPADWPPAHWHYVTMYNSGDVGNRYTSGLRSLRVTRLEGAR